MILCLFAHQSGPKRPVSHNTVAQKGGQQYLALGQKHWEIDLEGTQAVIKSRGVEPAQKSESITLPCIKRPLRTSCPIPSSATNTHTHKAITDTRHTRLADSPIGHRRTHSTIYPTPPTNAPGIEGAGNKCLYCVCVRSWGSATASK